MSQAVGVTYKSKIPSFGDDASIVEAFRLYHYGIDNYSTGSPAANSIEGNFSSINTSLLSIDARITNETVKLISLTASPNIITPQSNATIPLTIRGVSSQSVNLLDIQNSASTTLFKITNNGSFGTSGYGSIGDVAVSSTTSLKITIGNSSHKGLVVSAASGQSVNLQEWKDDTGSTVSWVDYRGIMFSNGEEVGSGEGGLGSFLLIGA